MIVERILQIIDYKGITKSKFYKETGLSNGFLDKVKDIGTSKLDYILRTYPEVNINWLVTGRGHMLISELETKAINSTLHGIPLIPIEAMAGFGAGDIQVMDYETSNYVVPEFESVKADFMIKVKGSSMYPKYNSGDLIACKKLPLDTFFQWNKVYVLDTIQGALVKRITKSKNEGYINCKSDNQSYEAFDLSLTEIHALAIVVGVIRLE